MRILFVENHARFARIVIQEFLAEHEVCIVTSLADARVYLREMEFDVVLLDYDLDDGKGDVLARELKSTAQRPKIVAASSHDSGNNALIAAGADAVCHKMQFSNITEVLASILLNKE